MPRRITRDEITDLLGEQDNLRKPGWCVPPDVLAKKVEKPLMLVLFCGAGGTSMGYWRAGFNIIGVDIKPQPRYPFKIYQANALEVLYTLISGGEFEGYRLSDFDGIHASPPCQKFSPLRFITGVEYTDLLTPTREFLEQSNTPYVIENVGDAPMKNPMLLCGTMFGLRTFRHRQFEYSLNGTRIKPPPHNPHLRQQVRKLGDTALPYQFVQVAGHGSGIRESRWALGIDWMSRDELSQAIPPAYTSYIGCHLLNHLLGNPA